MRTLEDIGVQRGKKTEKKKQFPHSSLAIGVWGVSQRGAGFTEDRTDNRGVHNNEPVRTSNLEIVVYKWWTFKLLTPQPSLIGPSDFKSGSQVGLFLNTHRHKHTHQQENASYSNPSPALGLFISHKTHKRADHELHS